MTAEHMRALNFVLMRTPGHKNPVFTRSIFLPKVSAYNIADGPDKAGVSLNM